ncbi:nuclear transport factor 2 (ntf2) domain-containing protein [Cardiosporidium cionae]|uniref:Nuclear transport factor 2 (Ntf2) domain-containing protein n=1 Tax=Cardiosporidium cionae TaxID=476202 RepID=A0ABQ7J6H3_9APIC|nr:nuclear transport factor 2 (ntf2) domain-containing protein [Cardiosporidium cionae]|eukprot:KAF8819524.1 nuclear transport factor 2 (ntf2) domain-containing protein [Cardiosporidium cionae]
MQLLISSSTTLHCELKLGVELFSSSALHSILFLEDMACITHNSPLSTVVTPPTHYPAAVNTSYPFPYGQPPLPSVNSYPQTSAPSHGVAYSSGPPSLHAKECTLSNALDGNYEQMPVAPLPPVTVSPSSIGVQEVAHSFVFQYFSMLHVDPQNLHLFYDEDSKLSRLSEGHSSSSPIWWKAYGQREIYEGFEKCLVKNITSQIHCIEAQESSDGSILLLVTGSLTIANEPPREFVQSVYLAKQKSNHTLHPTNETVQDNVTEEKVVAELTDNEGTIEEVIAPQAIGTTIVPKQAAEKWNIDETYRNQSGNVVEETQQPLTTILEPTIAVERKPESASVPHSIESNKDEENNEFSSGAADCNENITSSPKPHGVGRHWGEMAPILESAPDPSWPRLSDSIKQKNASVKESTERPYSHDSSSFASKLMRNVSSKGTFQRGYAVQANKEEKGINGNSTTMLSGSTEMRIDYAGRPSFNRGAEQESHGRSNYANRNSHDAYSKYPHRGSYISRNEESKRNASGTSALSSAGAPNNANGKESSASPTTATSSGTNIREKNATAMEGDASVFQESNGEYRNNPLNRAKHDVERVPYANNGNRNSNWSDVNSARRKPRVSTGVISNVDGAGGKNFGNFPKASDRPGPMNRENSHGKPTQPFATIKS